ncbi:hypothetical protein BC937DRAFT_89807, partial [Endogone sp. FLAS-F59071]
MNRIPKSSPDVAINMVNTTSARSVPLEGTSNKPFDDNPAILIEIDDDPEFNGTTPQLLIRHVGSLVETTDSQGEPADQTHYLRAGTSLSGDIYLEATVPGNELDLGSVWLLFATDPWFSLGPTDRFSETALQNSGIWGFEVTTGSLTYDGVLCAQDSNSATADVTVGFGVAQSRDDEGNDQWSVYYMNSVGRGKVAIVYSIFVTAHPLEFATKGRLPENLYPVLHFEKPGQKVRLNYAGPFKHNGCKPVWVPHRSPVGLYERSPDRRHMASYSADDGILTVWRLHDSLPPELVSFTSIDDMNIVETPEEAEQYHHEQLTIVVSNTKDSEIPHVVLSRYHKDLGQAYWRILFLEFNASGKRERHLKNDPMSRVAGHLHLLDDGNTLLVVNARDLFVVDMRSRLPLRRFSTNELDFIGTIGTIGLRTAEARPGAPPLHRFDSECFLWYGITGFVALWHTSTGHLKQVFRLKLQAGEKYDYDKRHNIVAFYGGMGLRVFTIQTGMLIIQTKVPEDFRPHVVGVKFITAKNSVHLMTIECDETEYIVRIWNPLTGQSTTKSSKPHNLSSKSQSTFLHIGNGPSPISLVAQLHRSVAYLPVEDPFPEANIATESETYDQIKKNLLNEQLTTIETVSLGQVQLRFKSFLITPEPWNQDEPVCKWLSEKLLMIIGRQTVQIIDITSSSRRGLAIKHVWCVPKESATISDIELVTANDTNDTKVLQQFTVTYQLAHRHTDIIDVDLVSAKLSPKHASRYIQLSGINFQNSRQCAVYKQVLKSTLDSDAEIYNLNAVDFETLTSTFGHIIRGPQDAARERVKIFLDKGAFRPRFYDDTLWDQSALTEALAIKDFAIVTDIVRYCLKRSSTGGVKSLQLEPGFLAIVVGALPAISRVKPRLATQIAQYISNIPLSEYAKGFREEQKESDATVMYAFACVEKLSDARSWRTQTLERIKSLLLFKWTKSIRRTQETEDENRQTRPVISCVAPLYGLNRYPPKALPFRLSPFAELAFSHSAVFEEPAFQAIVQYKWNKFAGWYYLFLIFLYTLFALLYFIAVSISDPHVLAIAGVKWTIVVIAVLCLLLLDIRIM